jgi:hypothetical protein
MSCQLITVALKHRCISSFREEFVDGVCIGFRFFQHGQVSGIFQPLDANDAGNVVGEPLGNRRTEIRIVPALQNQSWMAKAPDSIDGSHRLEIVLTVQLPTQKTP